MLRGLLEGVAELKQHFLGERAAQELETDR